MNGFVSLMIFLFLFIVFLLILTILESNKKAKRLAAFSVAAEEETHSLFGSINKTFWNSMHAIGKDIPKTKWMIEEAKMYERYIPYKEKNKRSGYDYIAVKMVLIITALLVAIIGMMLAYFPYNPLVVLLAALIGILVPDYIWVNAYEKKLKKMEDQIYVAAKNIEGELKKRKTLEEALQYAMEYASPALIDELAKIKQEIRHGISASKAFYRFYKRTGLKEAKIMYETVVASEYLQDKIVNAFEKAALILEKENLRKQNKKDFLEEISWIPIVTRFLPMIAIVIGLYIHYEKYRFFISKEGSVVVVAMLIVYFLYGRIISRIVGGRV